MILKKTMEMGTVLRDSGLYNGKNITAIPGTPLNTLVESLADVGTGDPTERIMAASGKLNTANGSYDSNLSTISKSIAGVFRNIITVVKNDINPMALELLDLIEDDKLKYVSNKEGMPAGIHQIETPPLLSDPIFLDMIYSFVNYRSGPLSNRNATTDALANTFISSDYLELMLTGSGSVDSKIKSYFKNIADKEYKDALVYNLTDFQSLSLPELISMFLSLNGILNGKIPKGETILEDSSIRSDLAISRAVIGKFIAGIINRQNLLIRGGKIIAPVTESGVISVYGVNYRKWIKDGGSPEALMGLYLETPGSTIGNDSTLINQTTRLVSVYENKLNHIKKLDSIESITTTRRTITKYVSELIASKDLESNEKQELQAKLSQALKEQYYGDSNLKQYVRHVLCSVFTNGPEVYDILTAVELELASDDKVELDHAIHVAAIRMVGKWVASQIKINNV